MISKRELQKQKTKVTYLKKQKESLKVREQIQGLQKKLRVINNYINIYEYRNGIKKPKINKKVKKV